MTERAISGWEAVTGTLALFAYLFALYMMWSGMWREYDRDGEER